MCAAWYPVRYTSDRVSREFSSPSSAVAGSTSGTTTRLPSASGMRASSACRPPVSGEPYHPPCTQEVWNPSRQNTQVLSENANGAMTKSPFLTFVTALPVSSTTPMSSWPIGLPWAEPGMEW
ncbi:hypothetical protein D3C74_319950 [compost metagenome]